MSLGAASTPPESHVQLPRRPSEACVLSAPWFLPDPAKVAGPLSGLLHGAPLYWTLPGFGGKRALSSIVAQLRF